MITKDDIIAVFGSVSECSKELAVTPQCVYALLKRQDTTILEDKIIGHLYRAGVNIFDLPTNFSGTSHG